MDVKRGEERDESRDSLLAPKRMGGLEGGQGHAFQRAYVLSRILDWAADEAVLSVVQEGWSDIELLCANGSRHLIQAKGTDVGLAELREILTDFGAREHDTGGSVYSQYVIACAHAVGAVARLKRVLERLRLATGYGDGESAELKEHLASLIARHDLEEHRAILESKVRIEPELGWLHSTRHVRRLLVGALIADCELEFDAAVAASLVLQEAVDSHRGACLETERIREIIEHRRSESLTDESSFVEITREYVESFRDSSLPSSFYRGAIPRWQDIAAERDIRRDLGPILQDVARDSSAPRLLIPVVAGGGEGKSTFSMRFAVDLAEAGYRIRYAKPEARELSIAGIEHLLRREGGTVFIIIDNAGRIANLAGFIESVANLGAGADIRVVVTCRPYEWRIVSQICRTGLDLLLDETGKPFSLSVLSRSEVEQLLVKLASENEINEVAPQDLDGVIDMCMRSSGGRMLPLVLELTRGERVVEVIRDEIRDIRALGANLLRAYRYVCLATSLHTSLTEEILVGLVGQDDVLLDVRLGLAGLVEVQGDRVSARHDKIGEMATAELYAGAEASLAEDVCRMLDLIIHHGAVDVLEDMVRWSFPIPENQLIRVVGKIVEAAHSFGREDLVLLALEVFREDRDHGDLANELLAVLTPWILDEFVFRFEGHRVKLDFEKLGLSLEQPFRWPSRDSPDRGDLASRTEEDTFQNALKWAELYEMSATGLRTKPEHERFLGGVVGLIYTVLAEAFENRASESIQRYADFIRGELDWHEARPFYEQALELDGENVRAHIGLSVCLYFDNECEAAVDHYKQAVKLDREAVYDDWRGESILRELLAGMDEFSELLKHIKGTAKRWHRQYSGILAEFEKLEPFINLKKPRTDWERKVREARSRPPSTLPGPDEVAEHCDHLTQFLSSINREARIHFFRNGEGPFAGYGSLLKED